VELVSTSLRAIALVAGPLAAAAAFLLLLCKPNQPDAMAMEALNDHLRIPYESHPLEVESGGVHQVKPWFEGRVDFAPAVGLGGDDDFPLQPNLRRRGYRSAAPGRASVRRRRASRRSRRR
jgi:hypothetical protein